MVEIKRSSSNIAERLFIGEILSAMVPPCRVSTKEWAEANRFLTSDVTSRPGRMDCMQTPWMLYVMECLDDPTIKVIVGKKSAQIAWTETINSYIGKTIDVDPRNIAIAFPRAKSVQKFYKEKLKPFISTTTCLKQKIGSLSKVSHLHIPFPGGFLMLANLGAADDAKSSVIPILIVEEPDGIKKDVNKQGDGMALLKQRMKSFSDGKLIYAGTPTDFSFSQVDLAYESSNKMRYMVPCHKCLEFHTLSFDNLKYDVYQDRMIHELYGRYNPETAYYEAPCCGAIWTFEQKNENVKKAVKYFNKGWQITRPEIEDVYGFAFNELLSSFESSNFVNLAKQKIRAMKAYEEGNEGLMKSLVNNSMGEAYRPLQAGVDIDELKTRRLNYPENVVVYDGLVLTCGIDVQHNRFAYVVRAWGRHGQSWLVTWNEIFGDVLDGDDPVWDRLEDMILQEWEHAAGGGRFLKIAAASIDSADGNTTELVYNFVLRLSLKHQHIFAVKGRGEGKNTDYEIFNEPGKMLVSNEEQSRKSLAETMGVNVFEMGAHRAHSEVLRRINLKSKKDRYYHCETAYGGYEEGLLSCVQTFNDGASRGGFMKKPGFAKEVIDCEKMALHAAYAIQIRNYTDKHWAEIERYLHAQGTKVN